MLTVKGLVGFYFPPFLASVIDAFSSTKVVACTFTHFFLLACIVQVAELSHDKWPLQSMEAFAKRRDGVEDMLMRIALQSLIAL